MERGALVGAERAEDLGDEVVRDHVGAGEHLAAGIGHLDDRAPAVALVAAAGDEALLLQLVDGGDDDRRRLAHEPRELLLRVGLVGRQHGERRVVATVDAQLGERGLTAGEDLDAGAVDEQRQAVVDAGGVDTAAVDLEVPHVAHGRHHSCGNDFGVESFCRPAYGPSHESFRDRIIPRSTALAHPRRARRRAVHGRAGRDDRERRAALDPRRPRLRRDGPPVGGQRLHPALRRLPAPRRPARRPPRPPPRLPHRHRPLRGRLAGGWSCDLAGPPRRCPRRAGLRRRAHVPRRARARGDDVPRRPRARDRDGHLGVARGPRRHRRRRRRRHPRRRGRLGVGLLRQRAGRHRGRAVRPAPRPRVARGGRRAPHVRRRRRADRDPRPHDPGVRRHRHRPARLGLGPHARAASPPASRCSRRSSPSSRARRPRSCRCGCSPTAACRPATWPSC